MKKSSWSVLIGLLTVVSLNAQEVVRDNENKQTKNIIKIHPLAALGGVIGLGYERVLKPKTSINFVLFQQFNEPNFDNNVFEKNYNMFFATEIRRYLSKQKLAPRGWYVSGGLFTEYNYNTYKDRRDNLERLWIGTFGRTGYQWVFKKALKGITTEVNGGLGYRTTTGIFDGGSEHLLDVYINWTIGYSW